MPFSSRAQALLERLGIPASLVAERGLREYPEAADLVLAELGAEGRRHLLEPAAADAWAHLKAAASEDGIALFIVSAFRSVDRQVEIIERKIAAGQSVPQILAVSAPPCFSEHHTGRAVDVGTPGCPPVEVEFEDTPAFQWLQRHAGRVGFVMSYPRDNASGYDYEPWHWCYQGAPNHEQQSAESIREGG